MSGEIERVAVGLFEDVRNMPSTAETSTKNCLLGSLCEQLGITVWYVETPFFWKDLLVDFPDNLRKSAGVVPKQYHLSLAILREDIYQIDATWDPPLQKAGFPVNRLFGHLQQTTLAVIPCGEIRIHTSIGEKWNSQKLKTNMSAEEESAFYTELNKWLETLRTKC